MDTVNYVNEQGTQAPGSSRKAILEAANRVGEASNDFLRYVMQETEVVEGEIVPEESERGYQVGICYTTSQLCRFISENLRWIQSSDSKFFILLIFL